VHLFNDINITLIHAMPPLIIHLI